MRESVSRVDSELFHLSHKDVELLGSQFVQAAGEVSIQHLVGILDRLSPPRFPCRRGLPQSRDSVFRIGGWTGSLGSTLGERYSASNEHDSDENVFHEWMTG